MIKSAKWKINLKIEELEKQISVIIYNYTYRH